MSVAESMALVWSRVFLPWTLEATVWSAAILVVLRIGRGWSPHARAAVAHAGTIKLLIAPALLTHVGLAASSFAILPARLTLAAGPAGSDGLGRAWQTAALVATLVAAAGTAWVCFRLGREAWRLKGIRQRAEPVAGETRGARGPRLTVLVSDETSTPFVMGLFRPAVVMPRHLLDRLRARDRAALIAHEAMHIRSADVVWTWLGTLLSALFWFHPLVRRVVSDGMTERELRCDDRVLAERAVAAKDYARALVDAAAAGLDAPRTRRGALTLPAVGHGLERRLRRVMEPTTRRRARLGSTRRIALAVVAGPFLLTTLGAAGSSPRPGEAGDRAALVSAHDPADDHRARHRREHRNNHRGHHH